MTTYIRASMLPAWPDCPRRAAARQFAQEIREAGHELRELEPSVGAALGTAVHAAAAAMAIAKRDTGEAGNVEDHLEQAVAGFREETAAGAVWDDSTPNRRTAEAQITRQTKAWGSHVLPQVDPLIVEQRYDADAGDGFLLTGQLDLVTDAGAVRDLKAGALPRPYHAQQGAYSLLLRSQREPMTPTSLLMDWVPRTRLKKAQETPETHAYDRREAEKAASGTIGAIKADLTRWRDGGRANEWSFLANNNSLLCSDRYCPAWGTTWCALGRPRNG